MARQPEKEAIMPASAAKAWVRSSNQGPLAERWAEQSARLAKAAPQSSELTMMMSEPNYDQREITIAQAQASRHTATLPPDVDSPQRRALADELREMQTQYGTLVFEIRDTQTRWLPSAAKNWRHKLAGTISADCFNEPPPTTKFADRWDCWTPTQDLRKLIEEWRPWLTWVRQVQATLNAARQFDSLPPGDQALELVKALANQQTAITDRCERIEAAIGALQMKRHPPRQKKLKLGKASRKQAIKQQEANP